MMSKPWIMAVPVFTICCALSGAEEVFPAGNLCISGSPKAPVRIVCDRTNNDAHEMGRYLKTYLKARKCVVSAIFAQKVDSTYTGPQIVLAMNTSVKTLSSGLISSKFPSKARDEAYILEAMKCNKAPVVILAGKDSLGIRAATARFVCKIANDGQKLWIAPCKEINDPFVRLRVADMGDSPRRQTPFCSPFKDTDEETWSESRLLAYPELFWQFGFNGLQIEESRGYGSVTDEDLPRIRHAQQTLARGAKKRKMFVSLFQWGDCLFHEGITYSWNNEDERRIMRLFIKDLAEDYAPLVDHVIIHIGDPGGCTRDGCDSYKTPQQITTAAVEAFRKVNPKVIGTVSTWANGNFWCHCPKKIDMSNYAPMFPWMADMKEFGVPAPDGAKFLDTTFMPADFGVALNRIYNEDQADQIVAAGRPVDIWAWYIGDNEMINNYWFNMQHIDSMLSRMPDKARDQIRMHTIEITFHGWPQIINSYIAAQKLWNPRRSLDSIEKEFCTAAFGPANAGTVLKLYRACENGWISPIPQPDDFGTAAYNQKLQKLVADAGKISFPKGWKSNFAFPVPAEKYVDMLTARVRLILAVSEAKLAVDKARIENGIEKNTAAYNLPAKSLTFVVSDSAGLDIIALGNADTPIALQPSHTLGQTFRTTKDFSRIGVKCPTWGSTDSGLTISLFDKPGGKLLASTQITNHTDNNIAWLETHQTAGNYYLDLSNPTGSQIGAYGSMSEAGDGEIIADRQIIPKEPDIILQIKKRAIDALPKLPIDPLYSQDTSIVNSGYQSLSFAEMIEQL